MEVKKNLRTTKVLMELYNGEKIRSPLLLSKALELIDDIPTSIEIKENFIKFENNFNQQILLKRLFYDVWGLELIFDGGFGKRVNLVYKYLRTRTVKAIVINFFYGIFIGNLTLGFLSSTDFESRNQQLKKIISLINSKLKKFFLCKYCGVKLSDNFKVKCNFCGIEHNFTELLLL
jgi:hypothetical protein